MKHILALLSWGLICNSKEPEAFTFAKMEVGHPVCWPISYLALMLSLIDIPYISYTTCTTKLLVSNTSKFFINFNPTHRNIYLNVKVK